MMDEKASPTNDLAPVTAITPLLTNTSVSSTIHPFFVERKPLVSLSSKSTCLKEGVSLGTAYDVTPQQPLSSVNSDSSVVPGRRSRFQPGLLTHDENTSTKVFDLTSTGGNFTARSAKNKYLRAQSVPAAIHF
jgi:hypothetical protein